MKCPTCGKFIGKIQGQVHYFMDEVKYIDNVTGYCRHCHKRVSPKDWIYEDFFPVPKEE